MPPEKESWKSGDTTSSEGDSVSGNKIGAALGTGATVVAGNISSTSQRGSSIALQTDDAVSPEFLNDHLAPYLKDLCDLQHFIDEMNGRSKQNIKINSISEVPKIDTELINSALNGLLPEWHTISVVHNDLASYLTRNYTNDDLHLLCFRLRIDYEDLPGDVISRKVIEIIKYCEKHNLLDFLIQECQYMRPKLTVPSVRF